MARLEVKNVANDFKVSDAELRLAGSEEADVVVVVVEETDVVVDDVVVEAAEVDEEAKVEVQTLLRLSAC